MYDIENTCLNQL